MLTDMPVDHVVRLEQGRSSQPSPQLLGALAWALGLSEDERDHLFHLAGYQSPVRGRGACLMRMLDLLGDTSTMVLSDLNSPGGGRERQGYASDRQGQHLACPAGAAGNCTGSLVLRTAAPVKLGGVRAVLQLGTARYTMAPGAAKTVTVKLVKGSKSLADRHGRIKVQAVAATGPAGKIALSSRRLTLAAGTVSR